MTETYPVSNLLSINIFQRFILRYTTNASSKFELSRIIESTLKTEDVFYLKWCFFNQKNFYDIDTCPFLGQI